MVVGGRKAGDRTVPQKKEKRREEGRKTYEKRMKGDVKEAL